MNELLKDELFAGAGDSVMTSFDFFPAEEQLPSDDICYFVTRNSLAPGEEGKQLLISFFHGMVQKRYFPRYILFAGEGATLIKKSSPLYADFAEAEINGTGLAVCRESAALCGGEKCYETRLLWDIADFPGIFEQVSKVVTI